jgi:hypothetical protein
MKVSKPAVKLFSDGRKNPNRLSRDIKPAANLESNDAMAPGEGLSQPVMAKGTSEAKNGCAPNHSKTYRRGPKASARDG